MSLHITTATSEDVSRVAQRTPGPWRERRRRAWAWIRAMSGYRAWPEPKEEDNPRLKRTRPRPKRMKLPQSARWMRTDPWWKSKMVDLRKKRENDAHAEEKPSP